MNPLGWHNERNRWHLFVSNKGLLTALVTYLHFAPFFFMYAGSLVKSYRVSKAMGYCWKCEQMWWEKESVIKEWREVRAGWTIAKTTTAFCSPNLFRSSPRFVRHSQNAMNDNILHLLLHFLTTLLLYLLHTLFKASPWDSFNQEPMQSYNFTVPAFWSPIVKPGLWNAAEMLCGCVAVAALSVGLSLTGEAPLPHKLIFVTLIALLTVFSPPFIYAMINCNRLGNGDLKNGWELDVKVRRVIHFACRNAFAWYLLGTQKFVDASFLTLSLFGLYKPDKGSQGDILTFFAPPIYMFFTSFRFWQEVGGKLVDVEDLKVVLYSMYQNISEFQSGVPAVIFINALVYVGHKSGHYLGYEMRKAIIRFSVGRFNSGGTVQNIPPEEKTRTRKWASWVSMAGALYFVGIAGVLMMSAE